MSLLRRVGTNSFIYSATTFLQKGVSFLLLPLYTRYLTPEDYGILAVVGSLGGVLSVLVTLSLNAAITRYYFVYRAHPKILREFWGTCLTLVLLVSVGTGAILFVLGTVLLKPFYGEIEFWPYVALGIATAALQPASLIFLSILQTREEAKRYALHSLIQFALTVALVVSLVVLMGWDATGPLLAGLVTTAVYFCVSVYALRDDLTLCLKSEHVRAAVQYSLPLVPHSLAGQVAAASDRVFLNQLVGTAAAGLYNVGALFGGIMSIVADSVNRAYVPAAMDALQSREHSRLEELRAVGLLLVATYSLFATALSLFAKELLGFLTAPPFHASYVVVPFIAFTFVVSGIYYLLVNILFFQERMTKLVAIGTVIGAAVNIALNYVLIGVFGLIGAALASLLGQVVTTVLIAAIAKPHDPVPWDYVKFATVPAACLAVSAGINGLQIDAAALLAAKVGSLVAVYCLLNLLLWNDVWFMLRHGVSAANRQMKALRSAGASHG